MKKSVISFLLVFLLANSLSSCVQKNKEVSKDPQSKSGSTSANAVTYPITKESITLRYWGPISPNATKYISSYAENEAYQEVEKRTGIKIDFIHPSGEQTFNLMIASGDIPDIIQGAGSYKGGVAAGVNDGVYLDLTPYAEKYAPDYLKVLNSDPDVRRAATSDDGKIQAFFRIKEKVDEPFRRLVTRKDWLDEAGMQVPATLTEWEAYLKFLKGSNKTDVPYTLIQRGMEGNFMGAYNLIAGFYLKDGKNVSFGQIQPQFKDYLTLMNKWFSYGYIGKEFLNETQGLKQFANGKTAIIANAINLAYQQGKQNNFTVVTAPFPRIKAGDKLHWNDPPPKVNGAETVISASSKYKTEAISWLNYGYSKEGAMLLNYGIKDKTYVIENGKPKYTDYMLKNPKYPIDAAAYIFRVHVAPKLTFSDLECFPPVIADGEESLNMRLKWSDDKNVDNTYVLPPISLTAEESDARAAIMEDVNEYVNEMVVKFISGAEPISRFDEYVSYIKNLKIDEAIQITQKSYERYIKK